MTVFSLICQVMCLTLSGERLMYTLRSITFKAMLRQEIAWFENKKNSTGALTVRLASDASCAKGVSVQYIKAQWYSIGIYLTKFPKICEWHVETIYWVWFFLFLFLQITGLQLGSVVETVVSMLVSIAIAGWASWVLTLVVLGFLAVMVIIGLFHLLAASLLSSGSKEDAGKVRDNVQHTLLTEVTYVRLSGWYC